jgi:uncharacterized protein (TIGR02646 family)
MIPVKRPPAIDSFTSPNGTAVKETEALLAFVAANPTAKIKFKTSVWKAAKKPYWNAQHSKCIFCEGFVPAQSHGDVEHFRPKNGVKELANGRKLLKTYWWLAYDWSNYWASCAKCNQAFKKNLFPLALDGVRALKPEDDLAVEKPLLIDPDVDDPRDHLIFNQEEIFPRDGSTRGKATIEICGLDREELVELRRLGLVAIRTVLGFYVSYPNELSIRQRSAEALKSFMAPNYPFSAMARDLIAREAPELLTP